MKKLVFIILLSVNLFAGVYDNAPQKKIISNFFLTKEVQVIEFCQRGNLFMTTIITTTSGVSVSTIRIGDTNAIVCQ